MADTLGDMIPNYSVLYHIFQAFKEHVDLENQKKSTKSSPDFINFIKAGTTPQLNQKFSKKKL